MAQRADISTAPSVVGSNDLDSTSTSAGPDGAIQGRASIDRILATEPDADFGALLKQLLGPIADDLDMTTPPPELMATAAKVADAMQAAASADPAVSKPEPTADGGLTNKLDQVLEKLLLDNTKGLFRLLPHGAELEQKLADRLGHAPPLEIWSGVLLAAVAVYFSKPHASHSQSFKINDSLNAHMAVDAGTFSALALKSINASISYHKKSLTATLSEYHLVHGANTVTGQISVTDLEVLHQKVDSAMLQFSETTYPDGRPPTEQFVGAIASKLDGYGFKISGVETIAATRATKDSPRRRSDTVSEEVTTPQFPILGKEGFQADLTATEHFGDKHAQDQLGGKLTLPAYHNITVALGETVPIGPGTGKPQLSADFTWKGVKLTISQGVIPQTPGFGSISENVGGGGHGWHVGLTLPIK